MVAASDTPMTYFAHVGGALSSVPKGRMGTHTCKHGSSDLLFAYVAPQLPEAVLLAKRPRRFCPVALACSVAVDGDGLLQLLAA
jgi:hypothetical protein